MLAPCRGYHRRGQTQIGAQDNVGLVGELAKMVYLVSGEVGTVGDPHRSVLHGVHSVFVVYRVGIVAAILPKRIVFVSDGRALSVAHRAFHVLSAEALEAFRALGRGRVVVGLLDVV